MVKIFKPVFRFDRKLQTDEVEGQRNHTSVSRIVYSMFLVTKQNKVKGWTFKIRPVL